MLKRAIIRKSSRILGFSVLVGTTAAMLAVGAPADAATVQSGAQSFYTVATHTLVHYGRGI